MKKHAIASIALVLSSIALTGCFKNDDASDSSKNGTGSASTGIVMETKPGVRGITSGKGKVRIEDNALALEKKFVIEEKDKASGLVEKKISDEGIAKLGIRKNGIVNAALNDFVTKGKRTDQFKYLNTVDGRYEIDENFNVKSFTPNPNNKALTPEFIKTRDRYVGKSIFDIPEFSQM